MHGGVAAVGDRRSCTCDGKTHARRNTMCQFLWDQLCSVSLYLIKGRAEVTESFLTEGVGETKTGFVPALEEAKRKEVF
jgi:hypothetical protein